MVLREQLSITNVPGAAADGGGFELYQELYNMYSVVWQLVGTAGIIVIKR